MKLKQYLKELNAIVFLHPEALEFEMIYSTDDEGNEYNKVNNVPSLISISNIDDNRFLEIEEKGKNNAVFVN
jgi:hypothetical protein